jgi:hypothetical protein
VQRAGNLRAVLADLPPLRAQIPAVTSN